MTPFVRCTAVDKPEARSSSEALPGGHRIRRVRADAGRAQRRKLCNGVLPGVWAVLVLTWAHAAQAQVGDEPGASEAPMPSPSPETNVDALPELEPEAAPAVGPAPVEMPQEVEGDSAEARGSSDGLLAAPLETEHPEQPLDAVEPAPEDEEGDAPKFTFGAGLRTGLRFGLSGDQESVLTLDDGLVDQVHIRPFMGGNFTPELGYFVQLEIGTPSGLGAFAVLDAIAQIKFVDELQLWVGQHIPANDRNNMNGPFFGNTWNFAIAVEEYPFDVGARDRGATVWGLIADGVLKYHLSVVDLQPGRDIGQSRVGGRLTLHLLEPENFYYNSGTYWGKQDILAIGAVVQAQKGIDDVEDSDLLGFSLDAMFEKNVPGAGTFTVEAGYWNYEETGAGYVVNQGTVDEGIGIAGPYPGSAYMGVLSWLTPEPVGIGHIQPNFRVQYADWLPETRLVVDAGIAYVVDGFNHKYHINYRHQRSDSNVNDDVSKADMIQFGVQYIMSN